MVDTAPGGLYALGDWGQDQTTLISSVGGSGPHRAVATPFQSCVEVTAVVDVVVCDVDVTVLLKPLPIVGLASRRGVVCTSVARSIRSICVTVCVDV